MMAGFGTAVLRRLRAVCVAAVLAISGILAGTLLQFPLLFVAAVTGVDSSGLIGYSFSTILQGVGFIGVVLLYTYRRGIFSFIQIRWPSLSDSQQLLHDLLWGIGGVIILFVTAPIVAFVLQSAGFAPGTNIIEQVGRENPMLLLVMVALSFLIIGPSEEILFRGGVQGRLRMSFSPATAVVGSSLLFGLAHTSAVVGATGPAGIIGYVVTTFALGVVLGTFYEVTSNLAVSIFIHSAYNAALFVFMFATEVT